MSSRITKSLLGCIYDTIYYRGTQMNYVGTFPQKSELQSLHKDSPTISELNNDYKKISCHFRHPVFVDFVPTHDELNECINSSWSKRYIDVHNHKK